MRRGLKGLIAGIVTATVGVLLVLMPIGATFEQNIGLSWLFNLRGPIQAPKDVVVVAIDDQTGEHLGISKLPREWPRSIHGRLVENLTRRGASAIVFDIDFQQPKQTDDDARFADAVAESGRVILVEKLVGRRQRLINSSGKQTGSVWMEQLGQPIPALAEAAKGLGPFPLPKVQVAVHQFWAFKTSVSAPTMPAVALQVHLMKAYPHLERLLHKLGMSAPPLLAQTAHASELQGFMQALRSIFSDNPELGKNLRAMLDNENIPPADRPLVQALIGLYQGGDHRFLNFYGTPGSILTIPYRLIADDQQPNPEIALPDLNGKVVFVGFSDLYDPGQPDRFYTVFTNDDGVDLSGVEIAATAFGNLLTDKSLSPPGEFGEIIIVALFGVIVGTMLYLLPAIAGVPIVLILITGYIAIAQWTFSESNVWLPLAIPILVQLPLALFGGLLVQYFLEKGKKERVTQAIGLYLPENLAHDFTKGNFDQAALNKVTYSVCFASDMAGFTTIAETLKPKELAAFLNDYFETLSAPLKRQGVDVIEFRADGIMCAWTADQPNIETRRKALLAGLEAVEAIAKFEKRYAQFAHSLRIGLEDGMAYIGHAGGGGHFVYSIVGDCANTAARIESLNKHLHTQLLASGTVMAEIEGLLCRFLGQFRFVGKTEALPIFEIIAVENLATESQKKLCKSFAHAMGELKLGHWQNASDLFDKILVDFPDDGPSQYHSVRCRRHIDQPPDGSPWIIHMDAK
ncbi:MAG: adenylate/guanylate cyclase domain-containing protein [Methylococcaceae bacterium]